MQKPCPDCLGTGNIKDYVCSRCQGYGRTPSARTEQGVDLHEIRVHLADGYALHADVRALIAEVESLRSRLSPGSEATDDPLRYAVESIIAGEVCAYAHEPNERFGGACNPCVAFSEKLAAQLAARRSVSATPDAPIPMTLFCPACGVQHIDEGEWATRPHKTHLCANCGNEWRPFNVATVGVGKCQTCAIVESGVCTNHVPAPGGGVPADLMKDTLDTVENLLYGDMNGYGPNAVEHREAARLRLETFRRIRDALEAAALPVPMLTEGEKACIEGIRRGYRLGTVGIGAVGDLLCCLDTLLASVPPHTEEKNHAGQD